MIRPLIASRLRRESTTVLKLASQSARRLTVAGVHDLRVALRRLRATLWIAACLARGGRRLRADLRDLGRVLGERRLLDVASIDARAFEFDPAALDDRRREAGDRVLELLQSRAALATAVTKSAGRVASSSRDRVSQGLARRASRLRKALANAPRGKLKLHRLRIELKKTRYLLDSLGGDGAFIKPLQELIGRAHDLEVLQELYGYDPRAAKEEARARDAAKKQLTKIAETALARLNALQVRVTS